MTAKMAKNNGVAEEETDDPKMSGRRENRAAAMQYLYVSQANAGVSPLKPPSAEELAVFFEMKDKPRRYYSFAEELIFGSTEHISEIDSLIQKYAKNWSVDRIARVDLAILRLAVFELLYRNDIPPIVSINEAVDLAKTYSSGESGRFINGILDSVKSTLKRPLRTSERT